MTDGSSRGFLISATLHGIAAALLLFSFITTRNEDEKPKVFELVAGEGDNYMAREAPALGSPGGVTLELPKAPEPKPAPPQPAPQEVIAPAPRPSPPEPKVVTPEPPKPPVTTAPDFKKKLRRDLIVAESKAKLEIKRKREADARREAQAKREADARKAADDQKPMTKEEFDRANKTKKSTTPGKSSPVKVAKIDAEGIAKGVVGGSTANKIGGAGGKALKVENDDVLAAYDAMFKQRLRTEFEPPPGLSDSLKVEIEVQSNADGSLSGGRVAKSSGSAEFDRAVLDALRRVRMPPRPDKKGESIGFIFTMRERTDG